MIREVDQSDRAGGGLHLRLEREKRSKEREVRRNGRKARLFGSRCPYLSVVKFPLCSI